jgi:hypothetical protein
MWRTAWWATVRKGRVLLELMNEDDAVHKGGMHERENRSYR